MIFLDNAVTWIFITTLILLAVIMASDDNVGLSIKDVVNANTCKYIKHL